MSLLDCGANNRLAAADFYDLHFDFDAIQSRQSNRAFTGLDTLYLDFEGLASIDQNTASTSLISLFAADGAGVVVEELPGRSVARRPVGPGTNFLAEPTMSPLTDRLPDRLPDRSAGQ